jgi:prepilin-type N-terminal cleavage/methylation domain-containing protein
MKKDSSGFSLIELLIVIGILLTISGVIFQVINLAMQRASAEQTKLDMFQEAREFMDQMSRDLRQAGYPSPRNLSSAVLNTSPVSNDPDAAAGLVQVAANELWFEGDVDGTGTVSVVHYYLDPSTSNNCPCLKRSQLPKVAGHPLTGQTTPSYQVEVQGVTNTDIFSARSGSTAIGLPVTFSSGSGMAIASIDTVQATLSLQGLIIDPQTRKKPVTTLVTTVRLNNCSQAASGELLSCR